MSNLFYIAGAVCIVLGLALLAIANWSGCADLLGPFYCGS